MTQSIQLETALADRRHEWLAKLRELGRELWRDKAGLIGVVLMTALVLMALAAPWIAPHDPAEQDLTARLRPP
ncbi:MAG: ABC transporter permease, partial [Desulfosarcinaceae bacterium]|nr:ABC transporter permease [Desulfosarcinaceae bacterium]